MNQDALKHKKDAGLLPRPHYYLALSSLTFGTSFSASTLISTPLASQLRAASALESASLMGACSYIIYVFLRNMRYRRIKQEVLPQTEIDFMHECEKNNDYDNKRYQDDVQILNINFVDRKQPSKLYHLKDIGGSAVYHAFQGDNEFVITGKLKDWHFRDQLHKINVPTLLTFGENETMPISTAKIMQKEIPNSRLVTTPDGGHHHMVDNPAVYYKHLARLHPDSLLLW